MAEDDRLDSVLTALGRIEAEQKNASESRGRMYDRFEKIDNKLGEVAEALPEIRFALQVASGVAQQARNNFNDFKRKYDEEAIPVIEGVKTFREEAEPIISDIRKVRRAIVILIGVLGFFGVGATSTLIFANDTAKAIVRDWLDVDIKSSVPPIN